MRWARYHGDERGASALEFAITAPVFLFILLGMIEGGLLLWTQVGLQHATESAARCAAINTSTCGNATAIQNYAVQQAYGLSVSPGVFTVSTPACGNQVSASYPFQFMVSVFGQQSLTLTGQSCFPK